MSCYVCGVNAPLIYKSRCAECIIGYIRGCEDDIEQLVDQLIATESALDAECEANIVLRKQLLARDEA
mgnify:CR=1 FL=1